jgi:biopolymer transport protein ExbD
MGAKLGSNDGPMADMNVTPLIDVVLVLLVVFMVITPMLQSGFPVELPQVTPATTANKVNAQEFITISVTKDGTWGVEQDEASDRDELLSLINAELAKDGAAYQRHFAENKLGPAPQPRRLLIKADGVMEYGKVREVMNIISDGGWSDIRLAVNEEG